MVLYRLKWFIGMLINMVRLVILTHSFSGKGSAEHLIGSHSSKPSRQHEMVMKLKTPSATILVGMDP